MAIAFLPDTLDVFVIVRMDRRQRAGAAERLLLGQARELVPTIVHPLQAALRVPRPENVRKGVGEHAIVGVAPRKGRVLSWRSELATRPIRSPRVGGHARGVWGRDYVFTFRRPPVQMFGSIARDQLEPVS